MSIDAGIEPAAWRVLAAFRTLALVYAVLLYLDERDGYRHPGAAWILLALMAIWTVVVSLAYRTARERPAGWLVPWLGADLVTALAAILASRLVDSPHHIAAGSPTLPVLWSAAPVLACAISRGWVAGIGAATAVGVADVIHRGGASTTTVTNIVLLLLAGALVGVVVPLARRGELALAQAESRAAATRERERLSRDIHDGVLQVLALISRRGAEIGGDAGQLAELAREQELSLRALVASEASTWPDWPGAAGVADVLALLAPHVQAGVTVSGPADPVLLEVDRAAQLVAAVGQALGNVTLHAGPGARAWVLVDDDGEVVSVLIRDDGAGFAAPRLEQARAEGRLGIQGSIVGRLRELGGEATITSAPGEGTVVELRLPRLASDRVRGRRR